MLHVVCAPPPHTHTRVRAHTAVLLRSELRSGRSPACREAEMVPAGSRQRPDRPDLIYVTRFASHRCGVWQLRGPRGLRHQVPRLEACLAKEQAAMESGSPGEELPTGSHAGVAATRDYSTSFQLRRSRAPRGPEQAARAGGGSSCQRAGAEWAAAIL